MFLDLRLASVYRLGEANRSGDAADLRNAMQVVELMHLGHDSAKQRAIRHHQMWLGRERSLPLTAYAEHGDPVDLHRGLRAFQDQRLELQLGFLFFHEGTPRFESAHITSRAPNGGMAGEARNTIVLAPPPDRE